MKVAVALNEAKLSAKIPCKLEDSAGLLIVESDDMSIQEYVTADWVKKMVYWDCEVLLCGQMYNKELFEDIAWNGITRYLAKDLTVSKAVKDMLDNKLELIRDYYGGNSCDSHKNGICHDDSQL